MAILHRLTASPTIGKGLDTVVQRCAENDAVLLTQDAVFWLSKPELRDIGPKVYVLLEDRLARGLPACTDSMSEVDFAGFVELAAKYDKMISW